MKIKIVSDSTCDLSPELISRYDIGITPLYVIKDEKEYRDGLDISFLDIFEHVDRGGELCKTAACSVMDYIRCFSEYTSQYDAVIQITIGSGFSSCYQNACIAADEFPNVYVVDSQNLSTGQGQIVVAAAKMTEQGLTASEIVEHLQVLIPKVEISFIVGQIDYLRKGGRCSAMAAFGANLLNLNPCIEVKNGEMVVVKKYRGNFEKCVCQYVQERLQERTDIEKDLVFITHAVTPEHVIKNVQQKIQEYGPFHEIVETHVGCTVSCHCGPRTLGVIVVRK